MLTVTLKPLQHRGQECIGIYFEISLRVQSALQIDIGTTERYLHVSKKQLVNVVSPFDDLWKKESIDW